MVNWVCEDDTFIRTSSPIMFHKQKYSTPPPVLNLQQEVKSACNGLGPFGRCHVSNGPSEEEDVGLWGVDHVVDPALGLLDPYPSPLVLGH